MSVREVRVTEDLSLREGELFLIAGPCVIESPDVVLRTADALRKISDEEGVPVIFKSSFDKANRSSVDSFRGPGLDEGLKVLERVKEEFGLPVLSDVHEVWQVEPASRILDVLQIPAFLCRQTDLLVAAGKSGRAVNVKKGQFMSPGDMVNAVLKVRSTGNENVFVTERGTTFGYNNLVVDMRSFSIMKEFTLTVFDATHSVQLPGGRGKSSGGDRRFAPPLALAAVAAGADGVFMEVHPDPDSALCDGPNSLPLSQVPLLVRRLKAVKEAVREE
ncbi:MAG: 3-deoxy-8-phosphooctulonate synthase [Deltaproteobacteria bacterium]|nr:MAG: 3-deoxy-8-phosphooctulonate synthase [Deltaproteobacteria bacterium]